MQKYSSEGTEVPASSGAVTLSIKSTIYCLQHSSLTPREDEETKQRRHNILPTVQKSIVAENTRQNKTVIMPLAQQLNILLETTSRLNTFTGTPS